MNVILKLTLIALVSNSVLTLPTSQNKNRRAADWWEDLFNDIFDWVVDVVSDAVLDLLGEQSESVQSFFDQIFATEDEGLAEEAEQVLIDGNLTALSGSELIEDAAALYDLVEAILNVDYDDVGQAVVDSLVEELEDAAAALINAGEAVISETDLVTETLANTTDGSINDEAVDEASDAVDAALENAEQLVDQAGESLEALFDASSDFEEQLADAVGELQSIIDDIVEAANQFTTFTDEVVTFAQDIYNAGIEIIQDLSDAVGKK